MARSRKVRRTIGDVVAVPLGDGGRRGFGLVLEEPLVAFFDLSADAGAEPPPEEIVRAPVAFRIWVMNRPIVEGEWPVVGRVAVPPELAEKPWFFKQDPITAKLTVGRTGSEELPPQKGQVDGLERAAVWSAEHVQERLRDHLARRPNRWVESLRPKRPSRADR